jgi:hypothetical protein
MGDETADRVEMGGGPRKSHLSRWWLVGVVLATVVVAVVAAVFIVARKKVEAGQPVPGQPPQAASLPGLPGQLLLTSPMRQQPVPGWKLTASQLGLPAGTKIKPLRNVGNRGFFLGITGEGWWLVGIDVGDGHLLFAPVQLGPSGNAEGIDCFVNGPAMVLCLRQDRDPNARARMWAINAQDGALISDGPTDLRLLPTQDHPRMEQVGDYIVAEVTGEGMHGVGAHGDLTWFVPGNGVPPATQYAAWRRDVAAPTLAAQGGTNPGDVVFSVADGKVVKPSLPKDRQLYTAIVYPNGFGYNYTTDNDSSDRVAFFDNSGKQLSRQEIVGKLLTGSLDVPMTETESSDFVLTLDGRKLLEIPRAERMTYARLIGTKLFITADQSQHNWRPYDLRTGASGETCNTDALGFNYIASDGNVAIAIGDTTPAHAIDLDTCKPLWSITGSTQTTVNEVWKVNTTLVQRTNDELFSLVAPR